MNCLKRFLGRTKNKSKRYPVAIDDLLIEFDEMDYCPMNLSGGDPVKEAIAWRDRLRYELDLLLDEKSAIERRAIEEFAQKIKDGVADYLYKTNFDGRKDNVVDLFELCEIVDKVVKVYENDN